MKQVLTGGLSSLWLQFGIKSSCMASFCPLLLYFGDTTHKGSEWALSCGDKYVVAEDPAGCSENGKMMKWSKHIIERAVIDSIWVT